MEHGSRASVWLGLRDSSGVGGGRKEEAMACTTNMPDPSLTAPSDVALMAE